MKNREIMTICTGGFLMATGHSLPVEHFYKFHRFKREVGKANRRLGEMQTDLLNECGIKPGKISEADAEAVDRFNAANNDLLDEDCGIEVKARIPFEFYKGVYDENRTTAGGQQMDIFSNISVEEIILDNLFETPEE